MSPGEGRRTRYVALGSSFAAGPGLAPLVDPAAGRSALNYPHLVADRLGLDLVDVTASGATIENVLEVGQLLLDGSRVAPQVTAVTGDADLVTVTVGGNDVQYLMAMLQCSALADPHSVPERMRAHLATPNSPDLVATRIAGLPPRFVRLLEAIAAGAPAARILIVDYLTVIGQRDVPGPWTPMGADDLATCREIASQLQAATALAAQRAGVELVSAADASRDHGGGAAQPWVTGWAFGDVAAGGVLPYHPNEAGMRAVADLVAARIAA